MTETIRVDAISTSGPDELTQNSGDLEVQVEDGMILHYLIGQLMMLHVVMDNVLVSESDSSSGFGQTSAEILNS